MVDKVVSGPKSSKSAEEMWHCDEFAIYFHYGGGFEDVDGVKNYIGGNFVGRYGFDPDKFGYFDIEEEVKKLGFMSWSKMCYKIPNQNLYVILKSDKEVMQMLAYLSHRIRTVSIFIDGGKRLEDGFEEKSQEVVDENIGQNVGDNEESSCDIDVDYYPSDVVMIDYNFFLKKIVHVFVNF